MEKKSDFKFMLTFALASMMRLVLTVLVVMWMFPDWSFERAAIIAVMVDHAMESAAHHWAIYRNAIDHKDHMGLIGQTAENIDTLTRIVRRHVVPKTDTNEKP